MQYKNHVTMIMAAICFVLVAGTTVELIGALPNTGMAVTIGSDTGLNDQFTNYCEPTAANTGETCDLTCGEKICIPIHEMCDDSEPTECFCCEVKV